MRFVNRDWKDKPTILTSADTLAEVEKLATGTTKEIYPKIYKGEYTKDYKLQSSVREKLNESYHHKCGYCETFCKAEIEHYRPKKKVTKEPTHPGYYWLAYEWSNLLPSCRYCNTEGGKGNHFTIAGSRVNSPDFLPNGKLDKQKCLPNHLPLKGEMPYLLHPEIDDPKNHLGFTPNPQKVGIDIIPIDLGHTLLSRGSETIRICNLNREYLRLHRLDCVIKNILEEISRIFKLRKENLIQSDVDLIRALKIVLAGFETKSNDEKRQHTLLWWYITQSVENFKTLIFPLIETQNEKTILEAVINSYLKDKVNLTTATDNQTNKEL